MPQAVIARRSVTDAVLQAALCRAFLRLWKNGVDSGKKEVQLILDLENAENLQKGWEEDPSPDYWRASQKWRHTRTKEKRESKPGIREHLGRVKLERALREGVNLPRGKMTKA